MKSVLIIDRETRLANSLKNLAQVLGIEVEIVARKNAARQHFSTGQVGLIIANTELTTIRFDDLMTDFTSIQRRNRIPDVPVFFVFNPPLEDVANIPENVPKYYLLSRDTSLASIYGLLDAHILSDTTLERNGHFTRYSKLHDEFVQDYDSWLSDFDKVFSQLGVKHED